jgi:hypothetical protein
MMLSTAHFKFLILEMRVSGSQLRHQTFVKLQIPSASDPSHFRFVCSLPPCLRFCDVTAPSTHIGDGKKNTHQNHKVMRCAALFLLRESYQFLIPSPGELIEDAGEINVVPEKQYIAGQDNLEAHAHKYVLDPYRLTIAQ